MQISYWPMKLTVPRLKHECFAGSHAGTSSHTEQGNLYATRTSCNGYRNPIEQEGTYPLPEASADRFMLKVIIDYPKLEEERKSSAKISLEKIEVRPILKATDIMEARKWCAKSI